MGSFVRSRRFRFFNIHSPATETLAIELIDSVLQLIIPLQDYEPNPSGPARFVIGHDLGRLHWVSVRFKPILKIGIRNLERQVSDEQLGHGFLPGHSLFVLTNQE
jgi:hypothetical protein